MKHILIKNGNIGRNIVMLDDRRTLKVCEDIFSDVQPYNYLYG